MVERKIFAPESLFISVEGGEGCGKTTQMDLLYNAFNERFPGKDIVKTREPGGTDIAEKIRTILLDKDNKTMTSKTEVLLYSASRNQHCEEKIIPILNNSGYVISDRFYDSTYAYQGAGRKLDRENLDYITKYATLGLNPDATIYINIDPKIGLSRAKTRNELDRLESETIDFHQRVRDGFLEQAKLYPNRFIVINDPNISKNEDIKEKHYKIIDELNNKFNIDLEYQI